MARTKQTARKSSGGSAPRAQLASASSAVFRSFLTSQQASGPVGARGGAVADKRIFINCENVFGGVRFTRYGYFTCLRQALLALCTVPCFPDLARIDWSSA